MPAVAPRDAFILYSSQGQFPLTQNVTVVEGGTAILTCRVDQNDNTSLQWSNPAQQTLYFDDKKDAFRID
ncbi:hypothetical protein J1605_000256 [Eschrichtius robustus]|uniref:Ig-like domain-containing protein n=1 Tax=Eschrichtius robustus TaxID=9764 RepID=A0AB34HNM6_ESCRO|nr:hypothetical protein J1605_000256 [Eschrichtius robustus]